MNKLRLLILLLFVSPSLIQASLYQPSVHLDKYAYFTHLTTQDGLSHNLVLDIIQDKFGQMWFATLNGLTRFDGTHYFIYKNNPEQPYSLSDNTVTSLAEDSLGNLWVGTHNGLNRYNRSNDSFEQYKTKNGDTNNLQNNYIKALYADKEGYLWIECQDGFLSSLHIATQTWRHASHPSQKIEGNYYYHHIFEDSRHTLWLGGRLANITRIPSKDIQALQFPILNPDEIYFDPGCFAETKDSILLCSDYEGNIARYNPGTNQFNTILRVPLSPTCAIRDNDGKIWIGGYKGGLIRLDLAHNHYDIFQNAPQKEYTLISNSIYSLYKDRDGNIWAGTDKGVSIYPILRNHIRFYPIQNTTALLQDKDGLVWVGTENNGVDTFCLDREEFGNLTYNLLTQTLSKETFEREKETLKQYFLHETIISASSSPETVLANFNNYRTAQLHFAPFNENKVSAIYEDKTGKIYIGLWSHVGFNIFDKTTQTFKRYALWSKKPDYNYPYLLDGNPYGSNWYAGFLEDRKSKFWCATWEGVGLNLFDRNKGQFCGKHYMRQDYPQGYAHIQNMAFDKERKRLYLSGGRYYGYYDMERKLFTRYGEILPEDYPNRNILSDYYSYHNAELIHLPLYGKEFNFYYDGEDHIWLCGDNFIVKHSLSTNHIKSIFRTNTKWRFIIAPSPNKKHLYLCQNTELYQITLATDEIHKIKNHLQTGTIKALYVDSLLNLWIGAERGLYLYKPDTQTMDSLPLPALNGVTNITAIIGNHSGLYIGHSTGMVHISDSIDTWLSGTAISDINISEPGILWISTNKGLARLSLSNRECKVFTHDDLNPQSIPDDHVYYTFGPIEGQIWVSTREWISTLDLKELKFTNRSVPDSTSLTSRLASCIMEDSDGNIWLGTTEKGVNRLDPVTEKIKHFIHQAWDTTSLSDNNVTCLYQDCQKRIWVGTEKGLCLYSPEQEAFTRIKDLSNRTIRSVLEDKNLYIWIATDNGLYCLYNDTRLFRIFRTYLGFQGDDYSSAACKLKDGRLAFGGNNGFNIFDPAFLIDRPAPSPILLSHFKIRDSIRYTNLNELHEIELKYTDNSFSLDFSATDYIYATHLSYRYQLEGFDAKVTYTQAPYLNAKYTNIPPGKYRFRLEAMNHYGEWNGDTHYILIHITPPWYREPWFICITIILFISSILLYIRFRESKLKQQQILLEKLVSERTQKLTEAIDSKNRFFSIISHDLKNPIQSIYNTTHTLYSKYDRLDENEKLEILRVIDSTSQHTNNLLENLLLWVLSQREILQPNKQKIELRSFTDTLVEIFQPDIKDKNIRIVNAIPAETYVFSDKNILSTIIRNLLSNAIKYSFPNGEIKFSISSSSSPLKIEMQIEDHGIGIPEKTLAHLFKPGFKSQIRGTKQEKGNGLGLIIVYELIIKLKEHIFVSSKIGKGSKFRFTLSKCSKHENN